MVYLESDEGNLNPCKLKSQYYVNMKTFMRMSENKVHKMYSGGLSFTGIWKYAEHCILNSFDEQSWCNMSDQERRYFIEGVISV